MKKNLFSKTKKVRKMPLFLHFYKSLMFGLRGENPLTRKLLYLLLHSVCYDIVLGKYMKKTRLIQVVGNGKSILIASSNNYEYSFLDAIPKCGKFPLAIWKMLAP